jgi:hypothetical protein
MSILNILFSPVIALACNPKKIVNNYYSMFYFSFFEATICSNKLFFSCSIFSMRS